ncbi:major facilitator superfamily domain-containing protein [Apodospora peruviana]|uniref:Major facilitator superfamily domain-containing protein n=1 Tax=Apodospora peruviana TaxID=516989 RepID=A0AAE0HZJ3_9PEZI|nr:major facilitator superfamily domain-containing protein [Apodospora peruviana]
MSDEKPVAAETVDHSGLAKETGSDHARDSHDPSAYGRTTVGAEDLPRGWMYKRFRVFGHLMPWYASPKIQLGMVAFVCFMCPGMFNALGGLGGGGKTDATLADDMNTALYSTFAVFGFFGGTFVNKLGVKWTLAFGGIGYGIYAISLLVSVHNHVPGFNIFAGVFLGLCAALLWTAQGTIMISYPHENQKGQYFAWFWGIFNMGAVIGSLIPLGENIHVKENKTVSDGTYIGFIVLMFFGALLALLLCNAGDIVRKDGSRVILKKNPTWQSELVGLWETLRFEPFVILLFPMFFSSNWFYTYQQNAINGAYFDTRTKALNSLLYYSSQIIAAIIFGYLLDIERVRRTVRAKVALIVLVVLTFAIWGGGYAFEKQYTRESVAEGSGFKPADWTTPGYVGPMFLYMFYGFYDAAWQATIYWFMGALSNSGRRSANYVGFYKGIQSAGAAIVNNLDSRKLSYEAEFISNWALLASSLVIAAPVVWFKIRDHVDVEIDLKDTDETVADVLPQGHPEKATVV